MNIISVVSDYIEARDQIAAYFEYEGWEFPEDWTGRWWDIAAGSVVFDDNYADEMENGDYDWQYSERIRNGFVIHKELYTLARIADSFGESYMIILDNLRRIKCGS